MLRKGVIEHSVAPYASPYAYPDETYMQNVRKFQKLNKITVFDPEPMMSFNKEMLRDFFDRVRKANFSA